MIMRKTADTNVKIRLLLSLFFTISIISFTVTVIITIITITAATINFIFSPIIEEMVNVTFRFYCLSLRFLIPLTVKLR